MRGRRGQAGISRHDSGRTGKAGLDSPCIAAEPDEYDPSLRKRQPREALKALRLHGESRPAARETLRHARCAYNRRSHSGLSPWVGVAPLAVVNSLWLTAQAASGADGSGRTSSLLFCDRWPRALCSRSPLLPTGTRASSPFGGGRRADARLPTSEQELIPVNRKHCI